MTDKILNIILLIVLFAVIFFTRANTNEPRQNECYSVLDYNSSEYIICEIDMESGK